MDDFLKIAIGLIPVFLFHKEKPNTSAISLIKSDYGNWIKHISSQTGTPEKIIYGVIATESSGNPTAKGRDGEIGLMQLMPDTIAFLNNKFDLGLMKEAAFNPYNNILAGSLYLSYLYSETNDWNKAIIAYNIGLGNLDNPKIYARGKKYLNKVQRNVKNFEYYNKRFG